MHFLDTEPVITRIVAALDVPRGTGKRIHKDRASHGFAYFYGGESTFQFQNGTQIIVHTGDCIYLPMGSGYVVDHAPPENDQPNGCVAINFVLDAPISAPPFKMRVSGQQAFHASFLTTIRLWQRKGPGDQALCLSELYRILAHLQEQHRQQYTSGKAQALLRPAVDYISEHHTKQIIHTSALAEKCGISESYLRKLFQRVYGVAPAEYARQQRLSYARELLASGEYTVSTAAELSGFRDGAYFSREFKKMYQITPAEYIKSHTHEE